MSTDLNKAISHAVNYHGLDARLNMADWKIADLIEGEVQKWLDGTTDVQVIERMTPEERAKIGQEMHDGYLADAAHATSADEPTYAGAVEWGQRRSEGNRLMTTAEGQQTRSLHNTYRYVAEMRELLKATEAERDTLFADVARMKAAMESARMFITEGQPHTALAQINNALKGTTP